MSAEYTLSAKILERCNKLISNVYEQLICTSVAYNPDNKIKTYEIYLLTVTPAPRHTAHVREIKQGKNKDEKKKNKKQKTK
jgi:hypothetical protein